VADWSAQRLQRIAQRLSRAAGQYQTSPLRLFGRLVWLRAWRRLGLDEALFMGVLDPRMPARRAAELVSRRDFVRALRPFNQINKDMVDDKTIFYLHCTGCGLPIPRPLAFVTPPLGTTAAGSALRTETDWLRFISEQLPSEFVVKPAIGDRGRLVEMYRRRGDQFALGGRRMNADELRRRLTVDAVYGRAIVQVRLRNHPTLEELSGTDGLQCTRIVKVVTRAGNVEILYAFQKLISAGNQVDNFVSAEGNLLTCVDVAAGKLGTAFAMSPHLPSYTTCETHPVTGRKLTGFELPNWEEACALTRRAAMNFLPVRAIGWDVALTSDGPMLVEGNTEWVAFTDTGFWYTAKDLRRLTRLF
jgi:hypothetical protein